MILVSRNHESADAWGSNDANIVKINGHAITVASVVNRVLYFTTHDSVTKINDYQDLTVWRSPAHI